MNIEHKVVTSATNYPDHEVTAKSIKVLDTYTNFAWLIQHFGIQVRYNRMSRRREVIIPGFITDQDHEANNQLTYLRRLCVVNYMPNKFVDEYLDIIASSNAYHPIVEGLKNVVWDGIDRLNGENSFYDTLKTADKAFARLLIGTWMRGAIAAAHSVDGFTNHGVLVLQGDQGIGKTSWCKRLDPFSCGAVKSDASIDPRNKDSVIGLARFWIAEIGELDGTFNRSHIANIKGFITSNVDDVRVPWGRQESRFIRRTAYIATVNHDEFMVDTTGNRRWWALAVISCDYEHDFDMPQVWAQAKHELDQGGLTYLTREDQRRLAIHNQQFEITDPFLDLLHTNYDWTTSERRKLTCTDVLREIGFDKPSQKETNRMGIVLTKLTGKKSTRNNGVKVHLVPKLLIKWGS